MNTYYFPQLHTIAHSKHTKLRPFQCLTSSCLSQTQCLFLMCVLKLLFCVNCWSHWSQAYLTPWWKDFWWIYKPDLPANVFWQGSHSIWPFKLTICLLLSCGGCFVNWSGTFICSSQLSSNVSGSVVDGSSSSSFFVSVSALQSSLISSDFQIFQSISNFRTNFKFFSQFWIFEPIIYFGPIQNF